MLLQLARTRRKATNDPPLVTLVSLLSSRNVRLDPPDNRLSMVTRTSLLTRATEIPLFFPIPYRIDGARTFYSILIPRQMYSGSKP